MTNPKIEKAKANIAKTKAIIADYQAKLKEQEKHKIQLENDEIVAMFRRENLNEDEFKTILRSGRRNSQGQSDNREPDEDGGDDNAPLGDTHVVYSEVPAEIPEGTPPEIPNESPAGFSIEAPTGFSAEGKEGSLNDFT